MSSKNNIRIATFNIQGGANKKKRSLADDMKRYKINVLCTTETKINGNRVDLLKTTDGQTKYHHYTSGLQKNTKAGVGIIINTTCEADFTPINDRICKITLKINDNQNITIIFYLGFI